jgi:hypothetical protein
MTPTDQPVTTHTHHSLWDSLSKETHNDTSLFTSFDFNIEKDFVGDGLAGRGRCENATPGETTIIVTGGIHGRRNLQQRHSPTDGSKQSKKKNSNDLHCKYYLMNVSGKQITVVGK